MCFCKASSHFPVSSTQNMSIECNNELLQPCRANAAEQATGATIMPMSGGWITAEVPTSWTHVAVNMQMELCVRKQIFGGLG